MDDNPQTPHGGQLTVFITGLAGFVSTAIAADNSALEAWVDFQPNAPLEFGLKRFAEWVKKYPDLIGLI